jgi:adenylate kinase
MFNLILLGDPAAGKATQAQRITKKYRMFDFDMGKELRKKRATDSKLNKVLKNTTDKGNLTPTQIVRKIHHDKIFATPKTKGILFDGHPKMIGEAKLVKKWMDQQNRKADSVLVLYLKIPRTEIEKRMHNREEYFRGKYSKRADDTLKGLQNRIKYYRKNIAEVLKFFKTKYTFKTINGVGTPTEIYKRIEKEINAFTNQK